MLDEDGTVVETEAFFRTLEEGTVLMALSKGQTWAASKVSVPLGGRSLVCPICISGLSHLHPTRDQQGDDAGLGGTPGCWVRWDREGG